MSDAFSGLKYSPKMVMMSICRSLPPA